MARAARVLEPLANFLMARALSAFVLHTDATGLDVLDKNHPIKRGSLLCHVGDNDAVFFKYVPNQSKEGPQKILRNRVGYVCADAAGVYDGVFSRPGSQAIELGCWMHARRYFARALDAGDLRAAIALKYIKRLYKIEKQATRMGADATRRGQLREKKSKPVLASLHAWIAEMYAVEPPGTSLHKALTYAINQWQALTRYAEDGRLPIDNGPAERAITTVAVARKNFLFAGSDASGERAAIIFSVLSSCALAEVEPSSYLRDVFEKIANGWTAKRIDELLPEAWQAARDPPAEVVA
ncbi:IS66 family transposase [Myxococcota bacterium]